MNRFTLYSYWRSSCSYRVRIAAAAKGIDLTISPVNLLKGENHESEFIKHSPLGLLPALHDGEKNATIVESMAIMEYLEEAIQGGTKLLPTDPVDRATVRALAMMISCDIQPVQNLRVLKHDAIAPIKAEWGKEWITRGFVGLEAALTPVAGKYCFGDTFTIADCALVPQVYNANRFKVDMSAFPTISRVHAHLMEHDAVKAAHPDSQPDAPKEDDPPPAKKAKN